MCRRLFDPVTGNRAQAHLQGYYIRREDRRVARAKADCDDAPQQILASKQGLTNGSVREALPR
jgi:hypothetical protein